MASKQQKNKNGNKGKKNNELGISASKKKNFSEWYSQLIQKAELIEYSPVSGCMVIRPNAYSIWETVQSYMNHKFRKIGVQNAYFPMLIPESLLNKEKEHVKGFNPEVAWVTHSGSSKLDEKLAIRPTSETIMYDSYKKWIRSYKDLPLRLNQWCNIVRWEFKHPVPFLRTREFLWQEGHTVFATKKGAEQEVMDILDLYERVYKELYAVPVLKGKKSDSEKFAGADYSLSVEALLPNGKAIQGATTHFLGKNFAKAFGLTYLDDQGKKQHPYQNSWGYTTRSIGIMIAIHGDDKGLVLPPRVAPVHIAIIPIVFSNKPSANKQVMAAAKKVEQELETYKVVLDDREDYSPGFKFNYWELRGVPVRIEIGPRDVEKGQAVLVRRDTGVKESVPVKEIQVRIIKLLAEIQDDMYNKALEFLKKNIVEAKSLKELKKAVDKGKIVFAPWCGKEKCEAKTKEETGAKSLNMPFKQPKQKGKCFACGKKADAWAYFGRSY